MKPGDKMRGWQIPSLRKKVMTHEELLIMNIILKTSYTPGFLILECLKVILVRIPLPYIFPNHETLSISLPSISL